MTRNGNRQTTLEAIAEFTNGGAWNQTEYSNEGVPVVRVTDIKDETVDLSDCKFLPKSSLGKYAKHLLRAGDLVICTVGSHPTQPGSVVGRAAVMPDIAHDALLNQNAVCIRSSSPDVDQSWLGYFGRSRKFHDYIISCARGSANQVRMAIGLLKEMPIEVPPLPVQRRVAGVLSAYDELIENSKRRIRILEVMARAIYREWFVHFHFPGHENRPLVTSPLSDIPEGWEPTTLATQLSALESGKRPKGGIRDVEDGVASIGAENINGIGRHDYSVEKFVPREFFERMRKGVVCDRDVAIYKDGAYIGKSSYFRDGFPHAECCVNEHVFLLRSKGVRLKQNALYLWLQEPDTVHAIRAANANAAQPGINQQSVGGLQVLVPDEKTAAQFDRLIEPLLAEVINLAKRIQNLRRSRDLLLPRMLSGHIDVEAA
jgi:type I restriction enzyme, S subunit